MRRHRWLLAAWLPLTLAFAAPASAEWAFRQSYFSHDPATGERVSQYAPVAPSLTPVDPTFLRSGYRQNHVALYAGDGEDNLHVVETWGAGQWIRPYGEWLFPFRAGATPYGPWGNPQGPWTMPFDSWINPLSPNNRLYPYAPFPYAPYGAGAGAAGQFPGAAAAPYAGMGRGYGAPRGGHPRYAAPPGYGGAYGAGAGTPAPGPRPGED